MGKVNSRQSRQSTVVGFHGFRVAYHVRGTVLVSKELEQLGRNDVLPKQTRFEADDSSNGSIPREAIKPMPLQERSPPVQYSHQSCFTKLCATPRPPIYRRQMASTMGKGGRGRYCGEEGRSSFICASDVPVSFGLLTHRPPTSLHNLRCFCPFQADARSQCSASYGLGCIWITR